MNIAARRGPIKNVPDSIFGFVFVNFIAYHCIPLTKFFKLSILGSPLDLYTFLIVSVYLVDDLVDDLLY